MQPKLSVIVPVYNTAPYIERCIRSLMEQSLDDIEYIIINDASPDNAIEIAQRVIDDYPNRKPFVKIINHTENKGIAYTRQEGHDLATGEYIIHCDSDDWVDKDLYEQMYSIGKSTDADIVTCPVIFEYGSSNTEYSIPEYNNWGEFYHATKRPVLGLWCHMLKREMLTESNLTFYSNANYAEDIGLLFRCYFFSKKNCSSKGIYYHVNRQNQNSLTHSGYILKHVKDSEVIFYNLSEFVIKQGFNPNNSIILSIGKREVKEGYLLCNPPDIKRWQKSFPEITSVLLQDQKLSLSFRISLWLGQYINHKILGLYLALSKKKQSF